MATIKLQGIHTPQKAIPAAELKPGMITVWNYGYTSTVKSIEPTNPIDEAIKKRENTYRGIYSDVGCVLDGFTTAELAEYYIKRFGDGGLRYFLEQQIIAAEISRDKAI